jgi:hypothetical protein
VPQEQGERGPPVTVSLLAPDAPPVQDGPLAPGEPQVQDGWPREPDVKQVPHAKPPVQQAGWPALDAPQQQDDLPQPDAPAVPHSRAGLRSPHLRDVRQEQY